METVIGWVTLWLMMGLVIGPFVGTIIRQMGEPTAKVNTSLYIPQRGASVRVAYAQRNVCHAVGYWFTEKYQAQARQSGTYQAARNLRKQGVPLDVALMVLCGKV